MIGAIGKSGLVARFGRVCRRCAQWLSLSVPRRPEGNAIRETEEELRRLFALAPHLLHDVGFVPDAEESNQYQTVWKRGALVLVLGKENAAAE